MSSPLPPQKNAKKKQEKVELVAPPEGSAVGERLSFEGLAGGPFEPVSAAQMEKKKLLDKILPVRRHYFSATPASKRTIVSSLFVLFLDIR